MLPRPHGPRRAGLDGEAAEPGQQSRWDRVKVENTGTMLGSKA